eukprot:scaffold18825_cov125-Skeletonema_marinoi.AAC.3
MSCWMKRQRHEHRDEHGNNARAWISLVEREAFVGTMIKNQPLYIKGIDASNQELTKENAFGAMGMFIFLFSSSAIYICCYKHRNNEHEIRSQGYMRPSAMQRLGSRDYHVELPHSPSLELQHDSDDEVEVDEMSSILS